MMTLRGEINKLMMGDDYTGLEYVVVVFKVNFAVIIFVVVTGGKTTGHTL